MRRILLAISSLRMGGAERVLSLLAGHWAQRGWKLTVVTLDQADSDFFSLDPRVERVALGVMGQSSHPGQALANNLRRVQALRRAIKTACPQAVVSLVDQTNVLSVLACLGLGIPVVACEHTDPHLHHLGPIWRLLRRLAYARAAAITVVSRAGQDYFAGIKGLPKVWLLPNPVLIPAAPPPASGQSKQKLIMAMGRLAPEKGFDLLLRAFAACASTRPDWRLVILGEGPCRLELEALAAELGITDRVDLPGAVRDPAAHLAQGQLFVLSSRYEGFPMSLVEAMACGLPAIAAQCSSGPGEIVRHQIDGLLIPPQDVPALTQALTQLMDHPDTRAAMAAQAPQVAQRFSLPAVSQQWDALFASLGVR